MVVGICVGLAALMAFCMRSGRRLPPLGHGDLVRLCLYSEKVRREELHPFE